MNYKLLKIQVKLYALIVLSATIKHFVIPVLAATAVSIKATLSLPHNIAKAIEDAKESAEVERQLDDALIDPTLLDRIAAGEK
jgi:hypothetical protein